MTRDAVGPPHRSPRRPTPASCCYSPSRPERPTEAASGSAPDDPAYRTLTRLRSPKGCRDNAAPNRVERLEVLPERRRMYSDAPRQQIVVRAHFQTAKIPRRDGAGGLHIGATRRGDAHARRPGRIQQTAQAAVLVRYLDRNR